MALPSQAMPLTSSGLRMGTRAPSAGLVTSELTTISVIGVLLSVSCDTKRSTKGNLPLGIRYPGFIQKFSSGLVIRLIEVRCFIQ